MQVDPKEALMVSLKREVQLLRAENSYFRSQVSTNTHIPRTPASGETAGVLSSPCCGKAAHCRHQVLPFLATRWSVEAAGCMPMAKLCRTQGGRGADEGLVWWRRWARRESLRCLRRWRRPRLPRHRQQGSQSRRGRPAAAELAPARPQTGAAHPGVPAGRPGAHHQSGCLLAQCG